MNVILDTGPWVALIDKSESRHLECIRWFKGFYGNLYSSEAVFTEVLYLLNFSIEAQKAAFDFVLERVVEVIPADIDSMKHMKNLMVKYADIPMDYADASLVCLAENAEIPDIATFDQKDFTIYRWSKNRKFNILP